MKFMFLTLILGDCFSYSCPFDEHFITLHNRSAPMECCSSAKTFEKDPKKHLQAHPSVALLQGNTIVCSLVEKKNNTGILYNDRYLLLYGHSHLGYFNELKEGVVVPFRSLKEVPSLKVKLPLEHIRSWKVEDKILTIKYDESGGKKQEKEWIFRFDTVDLGKEWKHHLKKAQAERNDSQRRAMEEKKKPVSIVHIQEELKNDRNVIVREPEKLANNPLTVSVPPLSEVKYLDLNRVESEILAVPPTEQSYSSSRIIDKTNESKYRYDSTPSPKEQKIPFVHQSRFSPIDQINSKVSKSPSINSSYRESPPRVLPASNIAESKRGSPTTSAPGPNHNSLQISPRWMQSVPMKQTWTYRILKENVPQVLFQFREASSALAERIVDGIFIGSEDIQMRRIGEYELCTTQGELTAVVCFSGTRDNKENIEVSAWREFRNMEYLFCSTHNKVQPLVPLSSITVHKGILVHIFCSVGTTEEAKVANSVTERLVEATRLMKQWSPKQLVHSQQHNKLFCVQNKSYIPSLNNIQLCRNFLHLPQFQSVRFPSDLSLIPRSDKRFEYIQKTYDLNLKSAIRKLDNFDSPIVNSQDMEQFLEQEGIHSSQLGELHRLSQNPYTRKLIGYECIFHVSRSILFKQLQMSLKTTPQSTSLISDKNILQLNSSKGLMDIILNHLNVMVGKSKDGPVIWEIIDDQLGERFGVFKVDLSFEDGYYLQGLVYHFGVEVDWNKLKGKKGFSSEWNRSVLAGFRKKSVVYNCDDHLEFKAIRKLLENKSEESFRILIQSLDLFKSPIPEKLKVGRLDEEIKMFISLYMSPEEEQERFGHLEIYKDVGLEPPTRSSILLEISTLKWALKIHNKEKSLHIFERVTSRINRWMGPFHPYLTETYTLLSSYYETVEEYDQAITLAKSSIVNDLKIFGSHSLQIAKSYSFLADIYAATNKYDEALIQEKKAKNIYSSLNVKSPEYTQLLLRVSKLNLHFGKVTEAIEDVLVCLDYFDAQQVDEAVVETYETAARCYEVTKQVPQYKILASRAASKLLSIVDPLLLEKMVKICTISTLKQMDNSLKKGVREILGQLPKSVTQQAYIKGYQYIRSCLKEQRFDSYVQNVLSKLQPLSSMENKLESRLKMCLPRHNEKVVELVEALRNFVGPSFLARFVM